MPTLIELLESLWIRVGPLLNDLYPDGHPTYEDRHQHEVVLDAPRKSDGYMLREAIRQDLLEGGRNFLRHLEAKEGGGGRSVAVAHGSHSQMTACHAIYHKRHRVV